MAFCGLALAAFGAGRVTLPLALMGAVVGLALMLPAHIFGGLGAGDVKLFAAAGTLLGPGAMVPAFLITAIAGGALALAVSLSRGIGRRALRATWQVIVTRGRRPADAPASIHEFAYAPAIAVGIIAAAVR
jgi:prepilin peptidase CpaA